MYYTLHRRGWFEPSSYTDNQCKQKYHDDYHYHIIVVTEELDHQGFVVDHNDIHAMIRSSNIQGSCENLCEQIFKVVRRLPEMQSILAYKCILSPSIPNKEAYMEFKWCLKDNQEAFQLMCSL